MSLKPPDKPPDAPIQRTLEGTVEDLLLHKRFQRPRARFRQPIAMRRVVSISCAMLPDEFFGMLRQEGVRVVVDLRPLREYDRAGWADGRHIEHAMKAEGIQYVVLPEIIPTRTMLEVFRRAFISKGLGRDISAWSKLMEAYEDQWKANKPLSSGVLQRIVYNVEYEAMAFTCRCVHHLDCHRAVAAGILTKTIPGLELKVLYPPKLDREPGRDMPRRYLFKDFPLAGLTADVPIGVRDQHEKWLRDRSASAASERAPQDSGRQRR